VDAGTREGMHASAASRRAYNPRRLFVVTTAGESPQAVWEAQTSNCGDHRSPDTNHETRQEVTRNV
jgi:hypothetical protein